MATKTAAPRKVDRRKAWHDALDKVQADALKAFPEQVGKNEQLASVVATAHMLVDELHDTTPAVPHAL